MTLRARSSTGPASGGANRVELGRKASSVLTTTVDATVEKELAKQATTVPLPIFPGNVSLRTYILQSTAAIVDKTPPQEPFK